VTQEEGASNSALLPWKDVYKIVETKTQLLVYSSRVNAYVIPLVQLGPDLKELKNYIKERTDDFRLSFKS
jgi:hypothetical protein